MHDRAQAGRVLVHLIGPLRDEGVLADDQRRPACPAQKSKPWRQRPRQRRAERLHGFDPRTRTRAGLVRWTLVGQDQANAHHGLAHAHFVGQEAAARAVAAEQRRVGGALQVEHECDWRTVHTTEDRMRRFGAISVTALFVAVIAWRVHRQRAEQEQQQQEVERTEHGT